jgi:hypothetical protein
MSEQVVSQYEVSDAALSAFAVFFLQNPSFLAQQINLQKTQGKNNLHTLFGAYSNPCDNQIRRLLDEGVAKRATRYF